MLEIIKKKRADSGRKVRLAKRYAHRGYHDKPQIPENSMAAFRRAADSGFGPEFDVHLIADGSLVVFHDDDLERETGVKGQIEDYDIVNLRKLRLEGTDEHIPLLDDVLDLFENTGLPLLIELKVARGNYKELTRAVCERLDSYTGEYVIESFDPRALMELRKIRPDVIRGQLVQNFFKHREGLPYYQVVMLSYMMLNMAVKPDFIAYRFDDGRTDDDALSGGQNSQSVRAADDAPAGESIAQAGNTTGDFPAGGSDSQAGNEVVDDADDGLRARTGGTKAQAGRSGKAPSKAAAIWMLRLNALIRRKDVAKAVWTIRTREDYEEAVAEGCVPIFEGFDPDSEKR